MRLTSAIALALTFAIAVAAAHGQGDVPKDSLPAPPGSSQPSVTTQPASPPIATRRTTFDIPFSVDATAGPPAEVQLYVSPDQGANWQLSSRQPPQAGQFQFRATADGEYWFASRTIDAQGRSTPAGPLRPELRVVVDTSQPRLEFTTHVDSSGELRAEWQVYDANLDVKTFRVEYQAGLGQPWQPIAVDVPRDDAPRRNLTGRTTWLPPEGAPSLNVRAEVRDRAGNSTVVVRQVTVAKATARGAGSDDRDATPPPDPNANRPAPSVGATAWPVDNQPPAIAEAVLANQRPPMATSPPARPAEPRSQPSRTVAAQPASQPRPATSVDLDKLPSRQPGADQVRPGVADHVKVERPVPVAEPAVSLPSGVRPQMTNVKRFNLDYDVDAVGPGGVADVELWATIDGGRTWSRWGRDPDRKSPFDVAVDRDGIYGFSIVVIGQNGLASRPPQPGDLADVWIGVDSTPPQARLLSATYGEGAQVGQLVIRWQASDPGLTERPVTLSFGDRPEGPWTPIAAGLPNSGQYHWPADPRLPDKIYLRLEVLDEAGNVGVDQLTDPIDVQGLTPRGRIRGFRPAQDQPRGATQPRSFR